MWRVNSQSKCNSKCCCCGCLDNLRICLLADDRPAPAVPCGAACLPCRPPALPLACFPAPSPRPRSQSALPLRGRGRFFAFLCKGLRPLHPRGLNPGGTGKWGRITRPAGGLPCLLPANRAFSLLSCPHPPAPLPRRGRGSPKVYFAGGGAPGTPALNRLRHLQNLPSGCPAHGSLRFGAKPKEPPFHGQSRQPRRGGTGGDGTIRRKRRRRLRWSSPPGQGEQVPLGFSPRRAPQRQGRRATNQASPPLGEWFAPALSAAWVQSRGCKGRSPLHEITLVTPSPLGKGLGDRGQGSNLKARLASGKEGKPPVGHHSGKVGRRPTGQALPGT